MNIHIWIHSPTMEHECALPNEFVPIVLALGLGIRYLYPTIL